MRRALLLLLFMIGFLVVSYGVMILSISALVIIWTPVFKLLGG